MAAIAVTVEVRTLAARAWIAAVGPLRHVLGTHVTHSLAMWGVMRLARYRIERGPWRRFDA